MAIKQLTTKGNVWKCKDGYWNGAIRYIDEKGIRRSKCFGAKTKTELLKKLKDYKLQFQKEVEEADETIKPLKASMQKWLEVFKYQTVKRITYDNNENTARNYIYPKIGQKRIRDISAIDLKELLTQMMTDGYSHSTIKKVYCLLNQYFRYLYTEEILHKNPMKNVKMITKEILLVHQSKEEIAERDEIKIFTEEEIELIKNVILKDRRKERAKLFQSEINLLMLNTGIRPSEALGLLNRDIDLDNRLMKINRSVKEVKIRSENKDGYEYEIIVSNPKTKSSKRVVPLNHNAVEIIKRLRAKRYFGEDSPLVPDEKGNYSRPSGFRRQWESVLAYAGVEQKGQQCLRHTFATALVNGKKDENGVIHALPLRQVADILGHSTSTITEKYYVKREMKKLRGITKKFQF